MTTALRGVVFGLGSIARQSHLPGFRALADAGDPIEVVAGVDPALAGGTVDGMPVVASREEVGRFGPIDFIDVCTPTVSHVDLVLWGLAQGYHVVCEKPVALDPEEARAIARAARNSGRVVLPCHQHRYNPAWLQLRQWVDSGAIGRWHLAEFQVYRPSADLGLGQGTVPWRGRGAASRGGVLLDHGTHLLYLLTDLAGRPTGVQAWTGRLLHQEYDVEDTAQVLLEFGDRAAQLFLTWAGAGRENRIRLIGDRGQVEWQGGELRLQSAGGQETRDFRPALDKASYPGWFAALFKEFVTAVRARDGLPHLDDLTMIAEILSLAYHSAREGRRLPVPQR
jgi:predicted dehydrogenase